MQPTKCGGGSSQKVPSLNQKLFVIETCWDGEGQISPMECHWMYQAHSRADTMLGNSWPTQSKFLGFVFVCAFVVAWFALVLGLLCFEREIAGSWVNVEEGVAGRS